MGEAYPSSWAIRLSDGAKFATLSPTACGGKVPPVYDVGEIGNAVDADVDAYVERSDLWSDGLAAIRPLLLDRGLSESIEWGKPCYAHGARTS